MTTDMHIYTNGIDPFTFPVGDYMYHVHAGAPPGDEPPADPELAPETELRTRPDQTPTMSVSLDTQDFPRPTRVRLPFALVHGAEGIRTWFDEDHLGVSDSPVWFRLDTVSGASGPGIQTLLEGLGSFGGLEASVEIVGWSEPGDG